MDWNKFYNIKKLGYFFLYFTSILFGKFLFKYFLLGDYVLMKFDILHDSCSFSFVCFPIAQVFLNLDHSHSQYPYCHLSDIYFHLSFPFSYIYIYISFFPCLPLFLSISPSAKSCWNIQDSDKVFYGIKTKYQLNPLSLFLFIHLSTYFFTSCGIFPIYHSPLLLLSFLLSLSLSIYIYIYIYI